jgi:alpha-tubulin suppressor-like RCC1 family protein
MIFSRLFFTGLLLAFFTSLMGCNGVAEEKINKELEGNSKFSSLEITPSLQFLYVNQTQQFIASGGYPPYVFSLLSGGGSITSSGLYSAPPTKEQARVRVTDTKGTTRDALVNVEVEIAISPVSQKINVNSSFQFLTSGGSTPYTYSIVAGVSTVNSSGTVIGAAVPETAVLRVTDALGYYAEATVEVGNGPIISPTNATAPINTTFQFTATSGTPPLTWTLISGAGSINSSGLFSTSSTLGTSSIRIMDANGFYSFANISTFKQNQMSLGSSHSCFLLGSSQKVKCVGNRTASATGDQKLLIGDEPSDMGDNLPTPKMLQITSAQPLITSSNYYSHCAIFDDGLTRCWGYSGHGQNGGSTATTGQIAGTTEISFFPIPADIGNPIVDLARKGNSDYHHCGLYLDGSVKCWGYNNEGQLGQNNNIYYGSNFTTASLYSAPPISLGQAALKVETGYRHTCAILADKNVKCWGLNNFGQLGQEHTGNRGVATGEMQAIPLIDFTSDAVDLALGLYHSCALLASGQVTCWGRNSNGELGLQTNVTPLVNYGDEAGEIPSSLTPINLGTGRTALKIDAGHYHTCALLDNLTMKCWGYNNEGQLGQEDRIHRGAAVNSMGNNLPTVYFGPGVTIQDIYIGGNASCAVLTTKELKCWGDNQNGQTGLGLLRTNNVGDAVNEMGPNLSSVNLGSGITDIHQLSGPLVGTCAIVTQFNQKTMKCWGLNSNGVLGIEESSFGDEVSDLGVNLPNLDFGTSKEIVSLTGGSDYNCVRFADGTAKCWGNNGNNVLGTNGSGGASVGFGFQSMGVNLSYMIPGSGVTIAKIFPSLYGNTVTCGLFNSDTLTNALKCWGTGGYGVLGNDASTAYFIPSIQPINLGGGQTATDVAVGHYRVCAVLANGSVKCWGYNHVGQLGIGDLVNRGGTAGSMAALPTVNLGTSVLASQICAGIYHSCVTTTAGKVKCWGLNTSGQLGIGSIINKGEAPGDMGDALPFVDLGTGRTVTKVTCGNYHTCALLDNKKVKCWGQNGSGHLGLGNTTATGLSPSQMGNNLAFVNLGTNRQVLDIKTGGDHNCAVLHNNDIKCWGANSWGQLGLGNVSNTGDQLGEMGDALLPLALE